MTGTDIMLELKEIHTARERERSLTSQLVCAMDAGNAESADLLMDQLLALLTRFGPPETAGPLSLAA